MSSAGPDRVVLVTGPSGAGRSTAINVLEDLGYESVDNLPFSLLPRLLSGSSSGRPLALGIDTRNREFSTTALNDLIRTLSRRDDIALDVLYLDCRADILQRRFSETRRRHPMAPEESAAIGIARELECLGPVRRSATTLIDTSELNIHQLRAEIEKWFGAQPRARLAVSVESFSFKRGTPRGVDMMFDCRFLANPYWNPDLRPLDGRDSAVQAHVFGDARCAPFFDHVRDLTEMLLPAYADEGKAYFSVAFGCTGGQHRSVALAEKLGHALADAAWPVSVRHRDLARRQAIAGKP